MIETFTTQESQDHFAHCVQIFGGIPATSRRLGIDERAIRRLINGERPLSKGLLEDIKNALRLLVDEAISAERHIAAVLGC